MDQFPDSLQSVLRRLRRRLAIGVFLDVWPPWAAASLWIGGAIALGCRMWIPGATAALNWIWLAPAVAVFPAAYLCAARAYKPEQVAAIADSLNGGDGTLLSLFEIKDAAWSDCPVITRFGQFSMPRFRLWPRLRAVVPAILFLVFALMLPQRMPASSTNEILANDIATDLQSTLDELKNRKLLTSSEDEELQQEIDRIRKDALDRVDASSWEASDSLREKFVAKISEKQDAMKWAAEALSRYAAASASPDISGNASSAQSAELGTALDKLAQSGLLADAPADLQKLLGGKDAIAGGRTQLPKDAGSLRQLASSLSNYLAGRSGKFSGLSQLGKEAGRFDPSEFPVFSNTPGPDGNGDPDPGGVNRGRADAPLTWGQESLASDRFKSLPLPPGSFRGPDDWSPVAQLPGVPTVSPESSISSAVQQYAGVAGQTAWRRTLAPRHYSAVKKYFEAAPGGNK